MEHQLLQIFLQGNMVSQNSIYDIKISSVVPGFISGNNELHELTAMDLTMKLHYLRFVYYFTTPAFEGLTTVNIKETMFHWLSHAYIPCGRFRRAKSGRPFIKCNDGGLRIIEARCHLSLDEWLDSKHDSRHQFLVPNNVIGPDIAFSPLVMIQLTKFKCGATSIGLSWSHVLGDAHSAVAFLGLWAQAIAHHYPTQPLTMDKQHIQAHNFQSLDSTIDMLSVKRVGPVGDLWSTSSNTKMETFSFHISMSKLTQLQEKVSQEKANPQISPFECICVMIWHSLGKIQHESGPQTVTICKSDLRDRTKGVITNKSQIIGVVKTDIPIRECNPTQLGLLMMNHIVDERMKIEEAMKSDDQLPDFLIYGANLTFLDVSDVSFYEMEMSGQKPVYVNCFVDNTDDKGVVLVLPTPKGCSDGRMCDTPRIVNISLEANMSLRYQLLVSTYPLVSRAPINHLFFSCELTIAIWSKIATWWDIDIPMWSSMVEWANWIDGVRLTHGRKKCLEVVCLTTMWMQWTFRNRLLFDLSKPRKEHLWDSIQLQSYFWINARMSKFKIVCNITKQPFPHQKLESIYDIKMSTIVPGYISGNDAIQELTSMDLAMKLHYLRLVYYFKTPFEGLFTMKIKETLYKWLSHAFIPCGRFRRENSGRPFIKCNDSGVRLVEAKCHMSLEDWLESKDDSRHKLLVPAHVIGPDLAFSPLVMMQLTKFKCGATSVGMSWSHVLGDVFSTVGFIELWARIIGGHCPAQSLTMAQPNIQPCNIQSPSKSSDPLSIKRVGPVGDLWAISGKSKMETLSFHISMTELTRLQAKIYDRELGPPVPPFECICVVIWMCLAKIGHVSGQEVVTVCKSDLSNQTKEVITNKSQTIGIVKTNIPISECNPMQLALFMMNQVVDERIKIEEAIESSDDIPDFLIYGTNLTFVDFSDVSFYEMEVRGQKPVNVNCVIDGIDEKGVVLVLPTTNGCSDGRIVSVTLPENEGVELKNMLKKDWCIA
ncbi:hypothetical protein LXL04_033253 [Taraxacum kok-saghyz]